jgi:stringent starvation protein B
MHEWMTDNGQTPHLVVDVSVEGVVVPGQYVKDGRIILNVGHSAVVGLVMDNDSVSFQARFGGTPMSVFIPVRAILGIYARESGEGMLFGDEDNGGQPPPESDSTPGGGGSEGGSRRSHLKVVK